jgi:hypothetical protein
MSPVFRLCFCLSAGKLAWLLVHLFTSSHRSPSPVRREFVPNAKEKQPMRIQHILLSGLLGAALFATSPGFAQRDMPVDNIDAKRHPNLAEAQRLSDQAYQRIVAAQQANEWDMNGHAQKAKELLEQVNMHLKQAALAANKR